MKLLSRTIRAYLIYSFIVLLIAMPFFYVLVRKVLLHSVDKSLRLQLQDIRSNLASIQSIYEFQTWIRMDKDIRVAESATCEKDSLYTIYLQKRITDYDADPYRELAACIEVKGRRYRLIISNSLVENEDLLGSIVLVEAILLIVLLAGMLFINWRTSKKLWAPFYDSLSKIQRYRLSDGKAIDLSKTDILEFADLNESLQSVFNRNQQTYQAQKEFTENAAHEMQTPLAIFQGQIDLLMQTTPLSEEQASLISSLENNNQRLSKLSRSLLLLAKIENDEFPATEALSVSELMKKFVTSYQAQILKKDIRVTQDYQDPLVLNSNDALVGALISNLLSNAVRYNVQHGLLEIITSSATLKIRNTGVPKALDAEKLFRRFQRQESGQDGFGLGLAIAARICRLFGYDLEYQFVKDLHEFSIHFGTEIISM